MQAPSFDLLIIGEPSLDINTDYGGETVRETGGAVVYAGYAASALGNRTAVVPKANPKDMDMRALFAKARNVTVFPLESAGSTSIKNVYHTADRERRTCTAVSRIEPYAADEIPKADSRVIHIAGLVYGDIGNDVIALAARRAEAAVDAQCLLRHDEGGGMVFRDWKEKKEMLPLIRFLKTDAAEAEILTGTPDRAQAARRLFAWGAKEIMITHNTEALVYDGREIYTCPLRPRGLAGRTGRGDTCFAAYLGERLRAGIPEALLTASALVSLKMETPGPFMGTRADVEEYIRMFY
ncbi:MAG: pfkB family carbohydrate kinase [Firmicutes bacterium ADurb.Bin248]|nr:MAG: pfkB family carbohydrate kinase [Firmicutes bacterium ADurb.Bin248]HOG00381.1 PfkB family carbohydrate kinase [Clostridia bacterium]HPK15225.1 PfkB family carbohydrate kinase [Clostridia bacterium]